MTDEPLFSRSGQSNAMGKCTAEVKTFLPDETKEALSAMAVFSGQSLSEYLRDLIMRHVYGELHVLRMQKRSQNNKLESGQE